MKVRMRQDRRCGIVGWAAGGTLAIAAAVLLGPAVPNAAAGGCANAGARPGEATRMELKRALACLINHKRASRGKPKLDLNRKLNRAASSHTDRMLDQDCFEHRCTGERGLSRRVRATGYSQGAATWKAAENLGYAPTPRKMVRAWMGKRFTRKNLLNANFRDIGIGAGLGTPVAGKPDDEDITYTAVFAWRRG